MLLKIFSLLDADFDELGLAFNRVCDGRKTLRLLFFGLLKLHERTFFNFLG